MVILKSNKKGVIKYMKYYYKKKEELREEAKEHQRQVSEQSLSWWDVSAYAEHLYEKAKKCGLVRELRMNGVI